MRDILREITGGRRAFLFLDYDGTLVPIRKSPELAVLRASRRSLLERLSRNAFVCIVSGRSLADIQKLAAIEDIAYIGNHGLEIAFRGRRWVHPEAEKIKPVLKGVLERIRRRSRDRPGLLVEDKGLTGSIHYRRLSAPLPKGLREMVEREVRSNDGLRLTEGKKVFEIRPDIDWDKGKGVLELGRWLGIKRPALRIYIGDDQTDEDAFRALGGRDLTIHVGRRKDSSARSQLPDVAAVWKFLGALLPLVAPLPREEGQKINAACSSRRRRSP
jgi:trehalose 6-phosphate phosphatase